MSNELTNDSFSPKGAIVIGASAGAVDALNAILPALNAQFALPILIVVHVPSGKQSLLAQLFGERCQMNVREAEDKEPLEGRTVYFAPPDYHLLVEHGGSLALSSDEPVNFSRPSIDVLFESAADALGSALTAIVLTGANSDGARGLKTVCDAGGTAIVQLPGEAHVSAMPRAALEACPGALVMSLSEIVTYLRTLGAMK